MKHLLSTTFLIALMSTTTFAMGQDSNPVKVVPLTQKEVRDMRKVTGNIRAKLRVDVASLESGRVEKVYVREGNTVTEGEKLAELDTRQLKLKIAATHAQLEENNAHIARFKSELALLKKDLTDLKEAEKSLKGSVSDREMRGAQMKVTSTEGEIAILEASRKKLESTLTSQKMSLNDTTITAPFSGIVTKLYLDRGAWVSTGGKLLTLMSIHDVEAWMSIPTSVSPSTFKDIEDIYIVTDTGEKKLPVTSFRLLPDANEQSRNYRLIAQLTNSDKALFPGLSVMAHIPNGTRSIQKLIPSDAIMRNAAGFFVYKAQEGPMPTGKMGTMALPIPITINFRIGDIAAISSPDLKPGDLIVVEGNERLYPTAPIQALPAAGMSTSEDTKVEAK